MSLEIFVRAKCSRCPTCAEYWTAPTIRVTESYDESGNGSGSPEASLDPAPPPGWTSQGHSIYGDPYYLCGVCS